MMVLVTKHITNLSKYGQHNIGRLVQPRHFPRIADTPRWGYLWAADNDAFNNFHAGRYVKMLDKCEGVPGCLFVTAPDVVGDAVATRELLHIWTHPLLSKNLPIGYVLQDGQQAKDIPWHILSAVFIGGSTEFKLGPLARELVLEAKDKGLWVHMGRVNSQGRIRYAKSIGVDSIDGSSMARFTDTYLEKFARIAMEPISESLD